MSISSVYEYERTMPESGRFLKKRERERTRAVGDTPTACGVLLETGGEGGVLSRIFSAIN